ncbi:MAG: pentapeptide repeat-containing protein [Acidimicrobiia bacterium]
MQKGRLAVAMVVALVAVACSSGAGQPDEVGASCKLGPRVVCRGQDLRNVSMVAADLHGADFSGADLRGSDMRRADLSDAKLVGALLGAVDLSDASLVNADLTKANLFFTNLTGANMTGAIRTGIFACNVTQPDGSLVPGDCPTNPSATLVPTGPAPTSAPAIAYFRLEPPGKCLNDAAGTGVDVQWSTTNTTAISFAVDGIRIDGDSKARGTTRLPFVCDGKPHVVAMQAFGPVQPIATATITASLEAPAPLTVKG